MSPPYAYTNCAEGMAERNNYACRRKRTLRYGLGRSGRSYATSEMGETMFAKLTRRANRPLTFLNTLVLAREVSVPAFAQIEPVVVKAEKRSQDVQTVPIAISVFSSDKRDA